MKIAIDAASSELYDEARGMYLFPGESRMAGKEIRRSAQEMVDYYRRLVDVYKRQVVEPADGLETHVYEKAARMAGLKVAAYVGEAARELEPDEIITYETKPIFEQAAMYPDLPKVGYIHMLQSQGLLHDTYYYGVDAKQFIPTFMYPTEIMDGAIVSGNCVAPVSYTHLDVYKRQRKGFRKITNYPSSYKCECQVNRKTRGDSHPF